MDILSCLSTPAKIALCGVAAVLATALAPAAIAAEIKVIASNAVREPYRELVPIFEKNTGHKVTIDWGGTVDIVKRVGGGEVTDIVIIPAARIDDFVSQGRLVSRIDLARSGVGVAVRAGASRPDISSAAALRSALLAAKSIVLSAEVQFVTVFSAGLHAAAPSPEAARALLKFLTAPEAAPVLKRHGMEPG